MSVRDFSVAMFAALVVSMAQGVQAQETVESVVNLQPTLSGASSEVISGGKVTYYGQWHAGRKTANGERFDPNALTMAHRTLPFGTLVRVTNLRNNQSVVVRVNDRGPVSRKRVGDLTTAAASKINMLRAGVADVLLEIVNDILPGKDEKH